MAHDTCRFCLADRKRSICPRCTSENKKYKVHLPDVNKFCGIGSRFQVDNNQKENWTMAPRRWAEPSAPDWFLRLP